MGKVYAPQQPLIRSRQLNRSIPMNLSPAAEYGDLEVLLDIRDIAFSSGPMMSKLKLALKNFCDDDYIIGVGDPSALGATIMVASKINNGRVNLLKWNRQTKSYILIRLEC